jgi:hypothetical protein
MEVRTKSGSRTYRGIAPRTIYNTLEKLRKRSGGKLKTKSIVDEARPESSPIHNGFTWDDEKAAELRREWEARMLVKSIVIIREEGEDPRPAFVTVRIKTDDDGDESDQHYQNTGVLVTLPDEFQSAYDLALEKLRGAQKSVDELRAIAKDQNKKDTVAALMVAAEALSMASAAMSTIH